MNDLSSDTISVIVPAKNEESAIGRCLDSVRAAGNNVDKKLEIIVVDNNSVDKTRNIAHEKGAKVLQCNANGMGAVRSFGVSNSIGYLIAFVDADCVVGETWLSAAILELEGVSVGAVGGFLDLPRNASWIEKGWALPFINRRDKNVELVGASLIFRRDIYEAVGGFNPSLKTGEDSEFSKKIISSGLYTIMVSDCNVTHYGYPSTIKGFVDRQIWQVRGQFSIRLLISDLSLMASLLFVFMVSAFAFLAVLADSIFIVPAMIALAMPALFSIKRSLSSGSFLPINIWPSVYLVSVLYFIGRFLGVVSAIFRKRYERSYK